MVSHDVLVDVVGAWRRPACRASRVGLGEALGGAQHADPRGHHLLQLAAYDAGHQARRARSSPAGSVHGRSSPGSTSAIRREKTRPSSSELEASRLAPCTPEQATSPVA